MSHDWPKLSHTVGMATMPEPQTKEMVLVARNACKYGFPPRLVMADTNEPYAFEDVTTVTYPTITAAVSVGLIPPIEPFWSSSLLRFERFEIEDEAQEA